MASVEIAGDVNDCSAYNGGFCNYEEIGLSTPPEKAIQSEGNHPICGLHNTGPYIRTIRRIACEVKTG